MSKCPICGGVSLNKYESLEGYKQGVFYSIFFCDNCDASYANPLMVDEEIYNLIYSQANIIPGYDRYYRYAEDVLKVDKPLQYLAEMEDTYWAIQEYVTQIEKEINPKILEVGCGLGYLTYSLVKAGYDTKGIDISERAIEEATNRYGEYYRCLDVFKYVNKAKYYDIIILTEVIEHIPNPLEFITALKSLLSPKGCILITTPNKNLIISKELYWDTELPPVHLWWLSKKSFKNMANILNMDISFIDFTGFQSKLHGRRLYNMPWRQQTLSKEGDILFKVKHIRLRYKIKRLLINYNLLKKWHKFKYVIVSKEERDNLSESDRLCAILLNK